MVTGGSSIIRNKRKLPTPFTTLRKLAIIIAPNAATMAFTTSSSSSTATTATSNAVGTCASSAALDQARKLVLPSTDKVLARDGSVYQFWDRNDELLEQAWKEWNDTPEAKSLPKIDASILNPKLREAVEKAWAEPTIENEQAIRDLWTEVAPGVFTVEFFDTAQIHKLQQWFTAVHTAGIPTRPPYGIVLNRKGVMIDRRSVGYYAAPDFQTFYQLLVDEYVRPLGRIFFPEHIRETDDDASFAFSIQYQGEQGGDKSIRHHTDASTVTFNINLDADKTWTGSSLVFFTPDGRQKLVEWAPGHAVMHLGKSMHAALPIETGTRSNWVIWTMPSGSQQVYGASSPLLGGEGLYPEEYQLSVEERWTKPVEQKDGHPRDYANRWSPF